MKTSAETRVLPVKLCRERLSTTASAQFLYDPRDPYAVVFVITSTGSPPVSWTFARELLSAGLHGGFGSGNVVIAPAPEGPALLIALESGTDFAVLRIDAAPVREFLDRTYRLVPAGDEEVDVDALLDRLLAS